MVIVTIKVLEFLNFVTTGIILWGLLNIRFFNVGSVRIMCFDIGFGNWCCLLILIYDSSWVLDFLDSLSFLLIWSDTEKLIQYNSSIVWLFTLEPFLIKFFWVTKVIHFGLVLWSWIYLSSVLYIDNSGVNFTGSGRCSSQSSIGSINGCFPGSMSEDNEGDDYDNGCLDDWETVADALMMLFVLGACLVCQSSVVSP